MHTIHITVNLNPLDFKVPHYFFLPKVMCIRYVKNILISNFHLIFISVCLIQNTV